MGGEGHAGMPTALALRLSFLFRNASMGRQSMSWTISSRKVGLNFHLPKK